MPPCFLLIFGFYHEPACRLAGLMEMDFLIEQIGIGSYISAMRYTPCANRKIKDCVQRWAYCPKKQNPN